MNILKSYIRKQLLKESLSSLGAAWLLKSILEHYDCWDFTFIRSKTNWTASQSPEYKKQETSYGFPQLVIDIEDNMRLAEDIWYEAEGKQLEWLENNFQTHELLGGLLLEFRIVLTQKEAAGKRGHTYFDGELTSQNPKALKIKTKWNKIVVSIDESEQSLKALAPTLAIGNIQSQNRLTPSKVSSFAIETLHTRTTMLHEFHHWIQGKVFQPSQKLPRFSNQPNSLKESFYQFVIQDLIKLGILEPADPSLPQHEKLYKILDLRTLRTFINVSNKKVHHLGTIILDKFDEMKKEWDNGNISQSEVEKLFTLVSPWFANKKNAFTRMRKKFLDKSRFAALTKTNKKIFLREGKNLEKDLNVEFFIQVNDIYQKTNQPSKMFSDGQDVYLSYKALRIPTDDDIRRGKTPNNRFSGEWKDYATELDAEIVTWLNQFVLHPNKEALCRILLADDQALKEQIKEFLKNNSLNRRFSSRNRENNAYLLNKIDRITQELIEVGMEFSETAQNQAQWKFIEKDLQTYQQSNSTERFTLATLSLLSRLQKKIKEHFGI